MVSFLFPMENWFDGLAYPSARTIDSCTSCHTNSTVLFVVLTFAQYTVDRCKKISGGKLLVLTRVGVCCLQVGVEKWHVKLFLLSLIGPDYKYNEKCHIIFLQYYLFFSIHVPPRIYVITYSMPHTCVLQCF